MNPAKVLRLARRLGGRIDRLLLVGCEPSPLPADDMREGLSDAVAAAVDGAVQMVLELIEKIRESENGSGKVARRGREIPSASA